MPDPRMKAPKDTAGLILSAKKRFEAHLDECDRCRRGPFDLCRVGADLLTRWNDDDAIAGAHRVFGLEPPR